MEKKLWLIVAFGGTTEAIQAEKLFKQDNIYGQLIPTPRSINSSCGLCWRTETAVRQSIEELLRQHKLEALSYTEMPM